MNQPAPVWVRKPIAPSAEVAYAHKLGRGMLLRQQIEELVKAINPAYVAEKNKKSYLAQHQARAEMNRIFGYGNWDVIEGDPVMMYEYTEAGTGQNSSKTYWITGYRAGVTVHVRDLWGMPVATITGTHAEQNVKLPDRGEAHAMAITSVLSYALRRALINLGDRFGLGLYAGGSIAPHGQYTIQLQDGVLYEPWSDASVPQGQPAQTQAYVQPGHETVQVVEGSGADDYYDPTVSDDPSDYDDGSPQQAVAKRNRSVKQRFENARQQVQQGNEAARSDSMQSRLQAGMKLDDGMQTSQEYAQDNS